MRPMSMTVMGDEKIADVTAYIKTLQSSSPKANIFGDAVVGKAAYTVCAACHGANGEGNQALNAPSLIGQHDWYIVRQLVGFKEGMRGAKLEDRYGMQMQPMSMTLVDAAAINNVMAYINTLK